MAAEDGKNVESFALGLIVAVLVYLLLHRELSRKRGLLTANASGGAGGSATGSAAGGRSGKGTGGCPGCSSCSGASVSPSQSYSSSSDYEPPISIGGQSLSGYPSGPGQSSNHGPDIAYAYSGGNTGTELLS
jgi:hypothetical protein